MYDGCILVIMPSKPTREEILRIVGQEQPLWVAHGYSHRFAYMGYGANSRSALKRHVEKLGIKYYGSMTTDYQAEIIRDQKREKKRELEKTKKNG